MRVSPRGEGFSVLGWTARPCLGFAPADSPKTPARRRQARLVVAIASLAALTLIDPAVAHAQIPAELLQGDICGLPPVAGSDRFELLLVAGLLVGLSHCAGMCGPLVMLFARNQRDADVDPLPPLVLYQVGRIGSYALLGALAGALGASIRGVTVLRGWQGGLSILLGIVIVLAGLGLAGLLRVEALPAALLRPGAWVSRTLHRLMRSRHAAAPLGLGLANGFLPCGAVYAMLLLAATSGDPGRGALTLVVFGLGTLPAMMGMGLFASLLEPRTRLAFQRLAALLVLAVGLQLTLRGLSANHLLDPLEVAGLRLW